MTKTDKYILDCIRTWVWSGFYSPADVDQMIGDILEPDANEEMLRASVAREFDRKTAAELEWPVETDCDSVDEAFEFLNSNGIVALHNAGMEMSDGVSDAFEVFDRKGDPSCRGYCFYHGQDVERVVNGGELCIAFGSFDRDRRNTLMSGGS